MRLYSWFFCRKSKLNLAILKVPQIWLQVLSDNLSMECVSDMKPFYTMFFSDVILQCSTAGNCEIPDVLYLLHWDLVRTHSNIQWNLSVTTTSIIKSITYDLFSNVFEWRLNVPIYSCYPYLPFGAHLGGLWPPRWASEGREVCH